MVRGRESYKIRHFQQKHKDEDPKDSLKYIVPINHEEAKKLLTKREETKACVAEELENEDVHAVQSLSAETGIEYFNVEEEEREEQDSTLVKGTQRSLTSFFKTEKTADTNDGKVDKIQCDVSKILIMLETMSSGKKKQPANNESVATIADQRFKDAQNLLEIDHPDVLIETLEDGCRVTCIPCRNFVMSQPKKKR